MVSEPDWISLDRSPRLEVSGYEVRVEGEAFELWHEGEVGHVALEWRFSAINEVHMAVSENSVPLKPMVMLIIIPIKWL